MVTDADVPPLLAWIDYSNGKTASGGWTSDGSGQELPSGYITGLSPDVKQTFNGDLSRKLPTLQKVYALNNDFAGWIRVDNTKIDYPIVQGTDNKYYLKHAFDGQLVFAASIFLDYRNDRDLLKNYNSIIYGHNIQDGTMFHTLQNFNYNPKLLDTVLIYIDTMDGTYVYKPFSFFKCPPTYEYVQRYFVSPEAWNDYLQKEKEMSMRELDVEVGPLDKIITLSTCTNTTNNYRFALHAKLVEIIK